MSSPAPHETEPDVNDTCHVDPKAMRPMPPQLIAFDSKDCSAFVGPRGAAKRFWQTPINYRGPTQEDAIAWIDQHNIDKLRDRLFIPCPHMIMRESKKDDPTETVRLRMISAFVRSKLMRILPQYSIIVKQGADFIEAIEKLDRTYQDSPGVLFWSNTYTAIYDGIVEVQKTTLCARCNAGLYGAPSGRAEDDDHQQLFLDDIYDQIPIIKRYERIVTAAQESKKSFIEADARAAAARDKADYDHRNVESARQTVFNILRVHRGTLALSPSNKRHLDDANHIDPEAGKRPRSHVEPYTRLTDDERVKNYGQSVVDSLATTTKPERISRIRAEAEEWARENLGRHDSLEIEIIPRFRAAIEAAPQEFLAIKGSPLTRAPAMPMTPTRRSRVKKDPSVLIWPKKTSDDVHDDRDRLPPDTQQADDFL